eukprot:TRINITY_DN91354_c0_g1_i1.p1 TRINITY_DN91354_c0_g1~~TRINITY_DN91354_c0_g1_i1.p1  ORF type:complete len:926 (-),score=159.24 TRINITY_DN91354_c0_g1_i1:15-2792(-)
MEWGAPRVGFFCVALLLALSLGSRPDDETEKLSPDAPAGDHQTEHHTVPVPSETCDASRDALITKDLACNIDTWSSRVLTFATSLDCTLARVNGMLRLVATELKDQDFRAHQRAKESVLSPHQSESLPADDDVNLIAGHECPGSHIRYKKLSGRVLFTLPIHPVHVSKLTTEQTYKRSLKYVKNAITAEKKDSEWISRLRVPFLLASTCANFTLDLAYPFISYPLEQQDVSAEDPCAATYVSKDFPYGEHLLAYLQEDQADPQDFPVLWRSPTQDPRRNNEHFALVMAMAYTYQGTPVGFVKADLATTAFAIRLERNVNALSEGAYFFVCDEKGRFMMSSQAARDELFWAGMTEQELMNKSGRNKCTYRTYGCHRGNNSLYTVSDAATLGTGMNFTQAFEEAHTFAMPCNMDLRAAQIWSPKCNCSHAVRYCSFSGYKNWTLFVGSPIPSLEGVAKADLSTFALEEHFWSSFSNRGQNVVIEKDIYVENTGRVAFPFLAAITMPDTNTRVEPHQATVGAGQRLKVKVIIQANQLGAGKTSGYLIVKPDPEASGSSCFDPLGVVDVTITKYKFYGEGVVDAIEEHQFELGMLATFAVVLLAIFLTRKIISERFQSWAAENAKLDTALQSLSTLPFPMVLLSLAGFRKLGKFLPHEELLNRSALTWLHTYEAIEQFVSSGMFIIFMSHQWTSFTEPDHTGKQYEAMLLAIEKVCHDFGRGDDDTYLWLDYASIPQQHRGLQTLAINSLTVYAANVSAFVIVAPSVAHADLKGEPCDKETYSRRAWCRAEQLSHLLAKSDESMYLAEGNSLHRLTPDWLEQSARVFDGELTCCRRKHVGMDLCDKERLVIPMLGLFAQYAARVHSTGASRRSNGSAKEVESKLHLLRKEAELFPEHFDCEFEDRSEKRVLFGGVLTRLKEREAEVEFD